MLKRIIKRDGSTEDFVPHKLNKWAEWASDGLGDRADWSTVVLNAVSTLEETTTSSKLQEALITSCLSMKSWPYYLIAGRLYAPHLQKQVFPNGIPDLRTHICKLQDLKVLTKLNYTDEQLDIINTYIDHKKDHDLAEFQLKYIKGKYALQNRVTKEIYETPQLTYMRLALVFSENEPEELKLNTVKDYYESLSKQQFGAPTPDYVHAGTGNGGMASCCLFVTDDDKDSINAGLNIAYNMSAEAAGIGGLMMIRTQGDPVRGGTIQHRGALSYQDALGVNTKANTQGGRGASVTSYYSVYHPEAVLLAQAQGVRTPVDKQLRNLHFAAESNLLFAKKALNNEDIFQFTIYSAPDLWKAQFSGDQDHFEQLYNKYEQDPNFKKTYVNARDLIVLIGKQEFEVGTNYECSIDEINRHTPFLDPIYSSNLCVEITEPTAPYRTTKDLYSEGDTGYILVEIENEPNRKIPYSEGLWKLEGESDIKEITYAGRLKPNDRIIHSSMEGVLTIKNILESVPTSEVALCNLASINVGVVDDDETYERLCYLALKKIDKTILSTNYVLPNVGYTARNRMNAGVGILGLAYHLAKKGLKYDTQEGLNEIHRVAERHSYFLIKASLRISKERGLAPWMYKTKWPQGWLPIDTYKKAVDELVTIGLQYDWEKLRKEIIANGGIGHSCLVSHMPTESSSKPLGIPNGVYPVRDLELNKSDETNVIEWCARDSDILDYQIAYDIANNAMVKFYAVIQKFTDHSTSADFYRNRTKDITVTTSSILEEFLLRHKFGVKSKYYQHSLLNDEQVKELESDPSLGFSDFIPEQQIITPEDSSDERCPGGYCDV